MEFLEKTTKALRELRKPNGYRRHSKELKKNIRGVDQQPRVDEVFKESQNVASKYRKWHQNKEDAKRKNSPNERPRAGNSVAFLLLPRLHRSFFLRLEVLRLEVFLHRLSYKSEAVYLILVRFTPQDVEPEKNAPPAAA